MRLLVDLGNTRLKCAIAEAGRMLPVQAFAHRGVDCRPALEAWVAPHRAGLREVWVSSVAAPDRTSEVLDVLAALGVPLHRARPQPEALGLIAGYERIEQLGVDRWLALLAALERGAAPCLIVGVGSALTIDALTGDGHHLGGLIAPSPEGMREALLARAPALSQRRGRVTDFAADTADGIESGCVLAAVALVDRSLSRLRSRVGGEATLLLCGGGAPALAPYLPPHREVPDLVLEGLARWAGAGHR